MIETPAAATAGPAHSNGVDNDATHDSQALERLLASVAALAKSANGASHTATVIRIVTRAATAVSGGGDAVPMARELSAGLHVDLQLTSGRMEWTRPSHFVACGQRHACASRMVMTYTDAVDELPADQWHGVAATAGS